MDPLQLAALGTALIALGTWGTRRGGARTRVARLLASLSPITPSEALQLGSRISDGRYIAVKGGIDAAEAFDDENHRPLVYRRERVLVEDGGVGGDRAWREIDRTVRSLPFSVSDARGSISIDADALAEGLVVVVRQWEGNVAELHAARREYASEAGSNLVADLAATDPRRGARVALEQISTIDSAIVVGSLRNGELTAAGGRPLILTTLERTEALRLLGAGARRALATSLGGLLSIGAGVALLVLALFVLAAGSAAASAVIEAAASASPTPIAPGGDVRNGGAAIGPGGLLELLAALALPLVIGGVTAAATLVVVRLRGR